MRRATERARDDLQRSNNSLAAFVRLAWHVVEPSRDYVHGWHIDAMAEHLEAVTRGQLTRLLINVPPGMMKSLMTSVFWPAYEWGPCARPDLRYVTYSYDKELSTRDALRCRRLIASDWYQALWGHVFSLTSDQNVKTRYENNRTGFRIADYVGGGTGERADRNIVDDPHNVKDGESEAKRESALLWLRETLPTRMTDPKHSAVVVIMQRIHARDMSGEIIARNMGYETLVLPMEFERDRRCVTSIGFSDPREKDGDLLFPQRFPREIVERDKQAMGSYAVAGQFQQRPAPREGGMFKRAWFEIVDAVPANVKRVRRWDLAATSFSGSNDPDWTVGVRMARAPDGIFYVEDVVRLRGSAAEVERAIKNTATQDGKAVAIRLPQDPGQAGKAQAAAYIRLLAGFDVRAQPETGAKQVRARPLEAQAEAGNVKLLRGAWNDAFIAELCDFPSGDHDDQVDAAANALSDLVSETASAQIFV
jgi:predicted phage terminase large subunit-like protein